MRLDPLTHSCVSVAGPTFAPVTSPPKPRHEAPSLHQQQFRPTLMQNPGSPSPSAKMRPAGGTIDSFSGLPTGSFSATVSPDRPIGGGHATSPSRKSPEQIALETQSAVQAALAAVADPNSTKAPFETSTRAPALKNQVKELSRHFNSVMRQSSSVMYQSLRGNRAFE